MLAARTPVLSQAPIDTSQHALSPNKTAFKTRSDKDSLLENGPDKSLTTTNLAILAKRQADKYRIALFPVNGGDDYLAEFHRRLREEPKMKMLETEWKRVCVLRSFSKTESFKNIYTATEEKQAEWNEIMRVVEELWATQTKNPKKAIEEIPEKMKSLRKYLDSQLELCAHLDAFIDKIKLKVADTGLPRSAHIENIALEMQRCRDANGYSGYFHPYLQKQTGSENRIEDNGVAKTATHTDSFVITPHHLINVLSFANDPSIDRQDFPEIYAADLDGLAREIAVPHSTKDEKNLKTQFSAQATIIHCGMLGLSHVKELLKDDAKQLTQQSMLISGTYYKDSDHFDTVKVRLFLSSPNVLKYAQSGLEVALREKMISSTENVATLDYKNKRYKVVTLAGFFNQGLKLESPDNRLLGDRAIQKFRQEWLHIFNTEVLPYRASVENGISSENRQPGREQNWTLAYKQLKANGLLATPPDKKDDLNTAPS